MHLDESRAVAGGELPQLATTQSAVHIPPLKHKVSDQLHCKPGQRR